MKTFLKLVKNPYAVMFAIIHWMIVPFLFFEGEKELSKDSILLFILIVMLDLPAIALAAVIWLPVYIFGNWDIFTNGVILISVLTSTFQWMIIGKMAFNLFDPSHSRMTTLSLKDE